ncbi:gfo/Idh/MocA family oxidoreductase [Altericroceibacterium spongiae]|uniref:Gfo/Idh/MocA family oxidoreductase n=1 Tax=Altericroceibacterium spongiae TaxID=2320269 RepID=A0A420EAD9_9SPHN|nr:Gfo/Idh/MocA family oxidoreductase [Altericroceibacterium spongiae]RKF17644.1 gfo/Idh/MocA family oxidoreductase [Altericroceibacterium spongiae]
MSKIRIALAGIGKIARDQHIPTIAKSDRFELVAAVTRHQPPEGVPGFTSVAEMMEAVPDIQAISICTPPRGRLKLIREALAHGLDVMIEKPPAGTIAEAARFQPLAEAAGKVLHATWHSREAAGVEPARDWLKGKIIQKVICNWKEDVRVWHPGQEWIWEPGIGVFDPGINALSVLTAILPEPLDLQSAELRVPENREAPIAADLEYRMGDAPVDVAFDFDQKGPQSWDIIVQCAEGELKLSMGASKLAIDGEPVELPEDPEYARLYRHFARLVDARQCDADLTPFRHVADAFLFGSRKQVAAFNW